MSFSALSIIWNPIELAFSHDFNPDIGGIVGLKPFAELYPEAFVAFENAFWEYVKHITELEKGPRAPEIRKNRNKPPALELVRDGGGFPLIPDPRAGDNAEGLLYQKQIVRTYVTLHYSKCP